MLNVDKIIEWFQDDHMKVNPDKFQCIGFGNVVNPCTLERGNSAVECRIRNQVSPSSNPTLLPFRRLGIFVLSIDTPVDSDV